MDFTNAKCVTYPGQNLWFSEELDDQRQARALCLKCPVQIECALYVREVKPTCGVWAGQLLGDPNTDPNPVKRKRTGRPVGKPAKIPISIEPGD